MIRKILRLGLVVGIVLWLGPRPIWADRFILSGGGQVEGELLNLNESPRRIYIIKTADGGRVTILKSQVKRILRKSAAERRYDELLPRCPDTADGHWRLAEWCRKNRLTKQRALHLEQVLKRDPNHAGARRGLGYNRLNGQWIRTDEWMKAHGYVRHKSRWRLPQEIQIESERNEMRQQGKDWKRKLKRWRGWLFHKRHDNALVEIRGIEDPLAAEALGDLLDREKDERVKLWYIEALGQLIIPPASESPVEGTIDEGENRPRRARRLTPAATDILVRWTLEDDERRIRHACLDELERHENRRAVSSLVAALRSKSNTRVNRAAIGLGWAGDRSSLLPLINALNTQHKFVLKGGPPGQIGTTFNRTPGGISIGGRRPKVRVRDIRNPESLDALLSMADGVDYGYDEARWKSWYIATQTPQNVNLRRDD